jgi:hypothetical protein
VALALIAFIALIVAAGCEGRLAPPTHYVIRMADPDVWSSYTESMARAAGKWQAATGLIIDVEVNDKPCDGPGLVRVTGRAAAWCTPTSCNDDGQLVGFTTVHTDWSSDIWVTEGLGGPTLDVVMLHELGHAIGLGHEPGANVMNRAPDPAWGISAINLADFHALYDAP